MGHSDKYIYRKRDSDFIEVDKMFSDTKPESVS